MATKQEVFQDIVRTWSERQDIDAVLAHLTEHVVWHYSAVTEPPKLGHAGAREFLEAHRTRMQNPRWRIFHVAEAGNTLMIEGVEEFDTADGGRVTVPYMGIFEFEGERIKAWRDYFSAHIAGPTETGMALPDHVAALLDRPALPGMDC